MDHFGRSASQIILENLGILAQVAVDRQYALQPDAWKIYQQKGNSKSLRDSKYHFLYLAESLAANDPALFLDYVAWAKPLFTSLDLPAGALEQSLRCMHESLQANLPPQVAVYACGYVETALERFPRMANTVLSYLSPDLPQSELAQAYLRNLLNGNRRAASQLIMDAVEGGVGVKDIYLNVFQPCQLEIGRLWQLNQISVAQEHFCTAATQLVISQLYPYIFTTKKKGYRLVATSVGEELHEIGMRMVADFMEMDGWDTYYLGANTPTGSVLRALDDREAHVLAISATLTLHVSKVSELISAIRSSVKNSAIKVLVGGYPFNISKNLWREVGADGYAPNAQEAVAAANLLMGTT